MAYKSLLLCLPKLTELTDEPHIFAQLHTHFTWILWSGARCLTETVALGCPTVPPWIGKDTEEGFSLVQMDKEDWLMRRYEQDDDDDDYLGSNCSLRHCKEILRSEFTAACYCALVGLQVPIEEFHEFACVIHGVFVL